MVPTTDKKRDRLTFGVEFEFALATIPLSSDPADQIADPDPKNPRPVIGLAGGNEDYTFGALTAVEEHIASTLSNAGMPAFSDLSDHSRGKSRSYFVVKRDPSIQCVDMSYLYYGVEVTTPPFYFSTAAVQTVMKMCEVLTNSYRINCNRSCAIQVHVGNSQKGFSVGQLKNLMSLLWTFEPILDTLHPQHRIDNEHFVPRLREKSRLAARKANEPEGSGVAGLTAILESTTVNEINEMLTPNRQMVTGAGRRMVYFIDNLIHDIPNKTIEFRQHESTLEPSRVANWISLCVGIVEFIDSGIPDEQLERFCRAHIKASKGEYTVLQFLKDIGLPGLSEYYGHWLGGQDSSSGKEEDDELAMYPIGPQE